jgi:hypothetical protein
MQPRDDATDEQARPLSDAELADLAGGIWLTVGLFGATLGAPT